MKKNTPASFFLCFLIMQCFSLNSSYALEQKIKNYDLTYLLTQIMKDHPSLDASLGDFKAKDALIRSSFWLPNPKIAYISERSNMTGESTNFYSLTQDIPSPFKLLAQGKSQAYMAEEARFTYKEKEWELRERLINSAYDFYSKKKVLEWLQEEKELLKEMARIVEGRRAAGTSTLQDEMKAHLEQSQIEADITIQEQALLVARSDLKEILGEENQGEEGFNTDLSLSLDPLPQFMENSADFQFEKVSSPSLERTYANLNYFDWQKSKAYGSLFPDISLSYQEATKAKDPRFPKDRSISIELTIPLWFFMREIPEIWAAQSNFVAAKSEKELKEREVKKKLKSLRFEVKNKEKILNLYQSTLIPQAESTLKASLSAYKVSRIPFSDLLESERRIYQLKIAYYQELKEFVSSLTALESLLGKSASNLPSFSCSKEFCP